MPQLRHFDGLRPHKNTLEARVAVLEQHLDDLLEVLAQFLQRRPLAVRRVLGVTSRVTLPGVPLDTSPTTP